MMRARQQPAREIGSVFMEESFPLKQYVQGTIPIDPPVFSVKGAIPDPASYCAQALTQRLIDKGIQVKGEALKGQSLRTAFHTTVSPSFETIVYWTNQKSVNLYAEHLLKKMGEEQYKEGSTEAGLRAVNAFLNAHQIDLGGFQMFDGSGLSRKNLVTAKQMVSVLVAMKKSEQFPAFLNSLPQLKKHTYAKSGSMSLIRCFIGYSGDIAFAILVNQCLDPALRQKLEQFISDLDRCCLKKEVSSLLVNHQEETF